MKNHNSRSKSEKKTYPCIGLAPSLAHVRYQLHRLIPIHRLTLRRKLTQRSGLHIIDHIIPIPKRYSLYRSVQTKSNEDTPRRLLELTLSMDWTVPIKSPLLYWSRARV